MVDTQNSLLFRIHSSWKQEIIAAVQRFEKEDVDGHQRTQIGCAFYGSTMILATGLSNQDIYACSRVCNIVTQIMTRHEASDELIRHGHIRLNDWHPDGQRMLTDPIHHLEQIAACEGRGPAELTRNLAGWLRIAQVLMQVPQEDKEKEPPKPVKLRHQAPPGHTLKGEDKALDEKQAGAIKTQSASSSERCPSPPSSARSERSEDHDVCQPGLTANRHTLSRLGYTPVLTGARATDATMRTQTSRVGTHIYGMVGAHWGKVVAEEQSAWRLAGGRIAKNKTITTKWNWGRKHASDFPDNPDGNPWDSSPQPDYPFSTCQDPAYVHSKAQTRSRLMCQAARPNHDYTHRGNTPSACGQPSPQTDVSRTCGDSRYPPTNDRNLGDTAKEVTIWWHVEVVA